MSPAAVPIDGEHGVAKLHGDPAPGDGVAAFDAAPDDGLRDRLRSCCAAEAWVVRWWPGASVPVRGRAVCGARTARPSSSMRAGSSRRSHSATRASAMPRPRTAVTGVPLPGHGAEAGGRRHCRRGRARREARRRQRLLRAAVQPRLPRVRVRPQRRRAPRRLPGPARQRPGDPSAASYSKSWPRSTGCDWASCSRRDEPVDARA